MKKILTVISIFLGLVSFSQLHQSLLPHLNDLTNFPASYTEAGAKCRTPNTSYCSTDTIVRAFTSKHIALQAQLNSTIPANGATLSDTAGVSKLQSMTPEQQRAWALQYAAQQQAAAASQPVKVPSADEMTFTKQYAAYIQTQHAFLDSILFSWNRISTNFTNQLTALDKKRDQQIENCPIVPNAKGDEKGPEGTCLKRAEKEYQNAVEALYADFLKQGQNLVATKKSEMQTRYSPMEALLARTNYMQNPSSPGLKNEAITVQSDILTCTQELEMVIVDTWSNGCKVQGLIADSKLRCNF
jgi:hypothetical protein